MELSCHLLIQNTELSTITVKAPIRGCGLVLNAGSFFSATRDEILTCIVKYYIVVTKVSATNELMMVIMQETVSLKKIPGKEKQADGQKASFECITLIFTQVVLRLCLKYRRSLHSEFTFYTKMTPALLHIIVCCLFESSTNYSSSTNAKTAVKISQNFSQQKY